MSTNKPREFSREFKLAAVQRMQAGENVCALSRELAVRRKSLYQWRELYRLGGAEAFRSRGRPRKGTSSLPPAPKPLAGPARAPVPEGPMAAAPVTGALAAAHERIAELERTVGRQQMDLDFFQHALRRLGEARRPSGGPGATPPTRSSKR